VIASVARRVGCTEGQVYTIATGVVAAAMLLWSGISPLPSDSFSAFVASPAAITRGAKAAPPTAPTPPVVPAPQLMSSLAPASADLATAGYPLDSSSVPSSPPSGGPATFAVVGPPGAPGGIAVGPDGRVFVTTDNGDGRGRPGASHVFAFTDGGGAAGDLTLSGQPANHTEGATGVAVDRDGSIVVLDAATDRVLRSAADLSTVTVLATIPDLKPCLLGVAAKPCEPGVTDHAPALVAAAFGGDGSLFVTDTGQATIWRLRPGAAAPEPWYQSQDLATGDGPSGLAFDSDGSILFTAGTTLDPSNVRGGALYRLTLGSDGAAGARTLVASFAPDDRPGALAVGPSGTAYVVVRKTATIVAIAHGATMPVATDGLPMPLDAPSGLALTGDRLLIANGSTSTDASHWAVLSLPV